MPSAPLAEVTFAAANAPQNVIRITSPVTLLNLVPYLLGFHQDNSVVIIGAKGPRSRVRVTQRLPLHEPPVIQRVTEFNAEHAVSMLTSQECSRAFVVGYGPEACVAPFAGYFRDQAIEHGVAVPEILRAEGRRYWSYVCTDPTCCPPEGTPFDPTPDPALTELLPEGTLGVLANREALASFVAAVSGPDAESMLASIRKAETRAAELIEQARAATSQSISHHPSAPAGIRAVQEAITRYRQGDAISYDEAAWLLVSLRDIWVRDDAWSRMEADHRQAHLRLWIDLTRLSRPGSVAAPASLLAFVAWQSGNGALAHVALDRALADDPDYKMAHILRRTLDCGMDPSKAKVPMNPEEVAESYTSGQKK
jgi:hypothetical protein